MEDLLKQRVQKVPTKKITTQPWQELAVEICKELRVEGSQRGIIFKACKNNNDAYVRHCFEETKELAKGDKASHYFIKLIYKK